MEEDNQEIQSGPGPVPEETGTPPVVELPPDTPAPVTEQAVADILTQTPAADMEVHHAHLHHKKKWTDYIFEFFMLFLAVSLGFFVENLREHYVEHERAKEYAAMLRKDLASDTTIMNIIVHFRGEQKKSFDTLRNMINTVPFEKINQQEFLRLSKQVGVYLHLISNSGTLQQLKSSGSLRYFTDTSLVYALTSYEEDLKHGDYVQGEEKQYCADRVIPFKLKYFNDAFKADFVSTDGAKNFPETGLVDFDKKAMMEFYTLLNKCAWYNEVLGNASYSHHKVKAAGILAMLDKEYHPE